MRRIDEELLEAVKRNNIKRVEKLIKAGADVNIKDNYNSWTPLHYAAWKECTKAPKLLIEAGADVNAAEGFGWTPLHKAAMYGYTEIVKLLIEAGANVNVKDNNGWTPLHFAAGKEHTKIAALLINNYSADVNAKNRYNTTPLHFAAENGHTETAKLLIKAGANVNVKDKDGFTPSYYAARGNHTEIFILLLLLGDFSLLNDELYNKARKEVTNEQKQALEKHRLITAVIYISLFLRKDDCFISSNISSMKLYFKMETNILGKKNKCLRTFVFL